MADNEAKIFNEKIKALGQMARNGALAVAIAAFVRWYHEGFDMTVAAWLASAVALTYIGVQVLSLLQPEE